MLRTIPVFLSASIALSGCGLLGAVGPPTPFPVGYIPTAVYLTAVSIDAATQTAQPATFTPTLTSTFMAPTLAATETPTPGPRVPLAAIQVRSPGPMSRIVSPLQVQLLAVAGASKRVEVSLYGEDGRLLGRTLIAVPGSPSGDTLSLKMPFEIRAAGENGFVQVSTKTAGGRLQSLITVPILLLSAGSSQVNPPGNTIYERVALADLPPEAEFSGGVVEVVGEILPYNRSPVLMELLTEEGQNLSLRVLNVSGEDWQAVHTTLPFRVNSTTTARLFVRQADDVLGGDGYVFSQLVTLHP
ncbi:MAG: hypothetical protein V1755_11955 [Chloroflexota bacterium]